MLDESTICILRVFQWLQPGVSSAYNIFGRILLVIGVGLCRMVFYMIQKFHDIEICHLVCLLFEENLILQFQPRVLN